MSSTSTGRRFRNFQSTSPLALTSLCLLPLLHAAIGACLPSSSQPPTPKSAPTSLMVLPNEFYLFYVRLFSLCLQSSKQSSSGGAFSYSYINSLCNYRKSFNMRLVYLHPQISRSICISLIGRFPYMPPISALPYSAL